MATRSSIATQIAQNVTDNTNFENTPARVRDVLNNINNSSLNYDTDVVSGGYSKNVGSITLAAIQALAAASGLIPNAFYRINNSAYGGIIRVQAEGLNTLFAAAFAETSATWETYTLSTDVFLPVAPSGEFTPTLTVTGSGSATATKMLYQKIGKIVSISGTITVSSAGASDIITPTLPFPFDSAKDFGICCTLADPLQYDTLTTSPSFDTKLGAFNNSGDLAIVLRATIVANYIIIYTGQYMTT